MFDTLEKGRLHVLEKSGRSAKPSKGCHLGLLYCYCSTCFFLQWEVAELVLEVFYKLLRDYEPQLEDFVDQFVELQGNLILSLSNKLSVIYKAIYNL